jgi:hypothetical protein
VKQEELFDAYLRQELNEIEMKDLVDLLESDPQIKEDFFLFIEETSSLIQCAHDMQSEHHFPEVEKSPTIITTHKNESKTLIPFKFKWVSAIAAALICAFLILSSQKLQTPKLTYRISEVQAKNFKIGAIDSMELISLNKNESLRLINKSGSRIQLIGPMQAQFINDKRIQLIDGRFSIELSEQDKGFQLTNSLKNIRDIGTAFAANLNDNKINLHVFEGLVEFGEQNKFLVKENESYTYSESKGFSSIPHLSKHMFSQNTVTPQSLNFKVLAGEDYFLKLNENTQQLSGLINIVNYNPRNPKVMLQIFADDEFIQGVQFTKNQNEIQVNLQNLDKVRMLKFSLTGSNKDIPTLYANLNFPMNHSQKPLSPSQILISDKANWYYYKDEAEPQEDWKTSEQAPVKWRQSQASFGYSDKARTEITEDNHPLHLRHSFTLDRKPNKWAQLILSTRLDDGAIFYLNGIELQRIYLAEGPLDQMTRANFRTESEAKFRTFILPVENLRQGSNTLAVSVYQFEKKSSDMFFNARLLLLE